MILSETEWEYDSTGAIMVKRLIASGGLAVSSSSSFVFGAVPSDDGFLVSVGHGPGACVPSVCSRWHSDL